jgi:hypothetical protein
MSTDNQILCLSRPAAEDLSSDQYKFVVLTAAETVRRPDSETEVGFGILQNAPALGEAASIMVLGVSKVHANAQLGAGTFLMPEFVDAADAGKAKTAAAALQYARAVMLNPTGAEDDLGSCLLIGPVPAITATAWQRATVTTDATAGARTYTIAELLGGMILRDPAGANRADVTPTAAEIVAGVAGAVVGSSFEVTIRNTANAAETITVTAGDAGVTLSGTMTIAQNNSKRFLAVLTNVTGGAEAVTLYSLGTVVH